MFPFQQENGLLTYAVSAKSGEGVNLCLQKVTAELLGIRFVHCMGKALFRTSIEI